VAVADGRGERGQCNLALARRLVELRCQFDGEYDWESGGKGLFEELLDAVVGKGGVDGA